MFPLEAESPARLISLRPPAPVSVRSVVLAPEPVRRAAGRAGQQLERVRGPERVGRRPVVRPERPGAAAEQPAQVVGVDRPPLGQKVGEDDEGALQGGQPAGDAVFHRFSPHGSWSGAVPRHPPERSLVRDRSPARSGAGRVTPDTACGSPAGRGGGPGPPRRLAGRRSGAHHGRVLHFPLTPQLGPSREGRPFPCPGAAPLARGRDLAGPARAGPCWPILPREADDEFRPEAVGATARRGAVAEAGPTPDADTAIPGSAVAPGARPAAGPSSRLSEPTPASPVKAPFRRRKRPCSPATRA